MICGACPHKMPVWSQHDGCWWPGANRHQVISNHHADDSQMPSIKQNLSWFPKYIVAYLHEDISNHQTLSTKCFQTNKPWVLILMGRHTSCPKAADKPPLPANQYSPWFGQLIPCVHSTNGGWWGLCNILQIHLHKARWKCPVAITWHCLTFHVHNGVANHALLCSNYLEWSNLADG